MTIAFDRRTVLHLLGVGDGDRHQLRIVDRADDRADEPVLLEAVEQRRPRGSSRALAHEPRLSHSVCVRSSAERRDHDDNEQPPHELSMSQLGLSFLL